MLSLRCAICLLYRYSSDWLRRSPLVPKRFIPVELMVKRKEPRRDQIAVHRKKHNERKGRIFSFSVKARNKYRFFWQNHKI